MADTSSLDIGFVNVDPATGSGNQTVTIKSVDSNTGRNSRYKDLRVRYNAGIIPVRVTQDGASAFVNAKVTKISVDGNLQTYTIEGNANTTLVSLSKATSGTEAKIMSFEAGGKKASIPETLGAPSASIDLTDTDPGALSAYSWKALIQITQNPSETDSREFNFIIGGTNAPSVAIVFIQGNGPSVLDVDTRTLTIGASAGSTATLQITSNTDWSIA